MKKALAIAALFALCSTPPVFAFAHVEREESLYRAVTGQEVARVDQPTEGVVHRVREVRIARDPGILRQTAPDRFDTHVYPILPFSLKQIEVLYAEACTARDGRATFRF